MGCPRWGPRLTHCNACKTASNRSMDVEQHVQGDVESDDEGDLVCFICVPADVSESTDVVVCDSPRAATKSARLPFWCMSLGVRGPVQIVRLNDQLHHCPMYLDQDYVCSIYRTLHRHRPEFQL